MEQALVWILSIALIAAAAWFFMRSSGGREIPDLLKPGQPLPAFKAKDEDGNLLNSSDLRGAPTVMLFVRGSWCPFCTEQVADLTSHYKEIVDLGGKLIFVTPKPLETTRRVAEMYGVDFDFWLDEDLAIAELLGLRHENAVPGDMQNEYGAATIWPGSLVMDGKGIIRFTEISEKIADRPNSEKLLSELRKVISS